MMDVVMCILLIGGYVVVGLTVDDALVEPGDPAARLGITILWPLVLLALLAVVLAHLPLLGGLSRD